MQHNQSVMNINDTGVLSVVPLCQTEITFLIILQSTNLPNFFLKQNWCAFFCNEYKVIN